MEEIRAAEEPDHPTILLVEDDLDTQIYMSLLLGKDFELLVAGSGSEAREYLAAHGRDIRLVLMDISLRGNENGLDLTRFIRNQPALHATPVVATTAHVFPEDRERAARAGCDAFLGKPFRLEDLVSTISRLLPA